MIERVPCTIKLLRAPKSWRSFYDFEDYERLVEAAQSRRRRGVSDRAARRRSRVCAAARSWRWSGRTSIWRSGSSRSRGPNGKATSRRRRVDGVRHVPLTVRLAEALRDARHLRGARVLCDDERQPLTQKMVQVTMRRAARTAQREAGRSHPATHVLFAPGDAGGAGEGDSGAGRTPGPDDDAAVHAPQPGGARCGDSAARSGPTGRLREPWRNSGGGGKSTLNSLDFLRKSGGGGGSRTRVRKHVVVGLYMRVRFCCSRARREEAAKNRRAPASENLAATRRGATWPPACLMAFDPQPPGEVRANVTA